MPRNFASEDKKQQVLSYKTTSIILYNIAIMEKNITLQQNDIRVYNTKLMQSKQVLNAMKKAATNPIEWLRQYYSIVLEREVSMGETLRYLHAQFAFFMGVFPTYDSLLVHAAVGAWTLWAILRCRN